MHTYVSFLASPSTRAAPRSRCFANAHTQVSGCPFRHPAYIRASCMCMNTYMHDKCTCICECIWICICIFTQGVCISSQLWSYPFRYPVASFQECISICTICAPSQDNYNIHKCTIRMYAHSQHKHNHDLQCFVCARHTITCLTRHTIACLTRQTVTCLTSRLILSSRAHVHKIRYLRRMRAHLFLCVRV